MEIEKEETWERYHMKPDELYKAFQATIFEDESGAVAIFENEIDEFGNVKTEMYCA